MQKKSWRKQHLIISCLRDFVIEDIRAETIRELETLIWDCSRNKISEYDLWTKADGKQEVKVYLRSLKLIIQDILADLGFAYKPPVSLVRIPRGERRTQIWTSQRSDLVENYCAPDRKGSCPGLHNYFQRRFVGENESLLWADPRWVGLFNFCKLQTVPNSSSQLMSCLCIGSDLAQHSRERLVQEGEFRFCLCIRLRQQQAQGHRKLMFALEPLRCIRLALT